MTYTHTEYADTERRVRISTKKGTTKYVRVTQAVFLHEDGFHTVCLHAYDDKGNYYFLDTSASHGGRFRGYRRTKKGRATGPMYLLG